MQRVSPQVAETHTGLVFLIGDRAYKAKKPVTTDFLDFSTLEQRELACSREVALNRRLAPDSYLGIGRFTPPHGGVSEPVIVMRRHPDERRLSTLVRRGESVDECLSAIATVLARFHASALRNSEVDAQGRAEAIAERWRENLAELERFARDIADVDIDVVDEIRRLVGDFIAGRASLFGRRIADRKIVDGHADLMADDIFCLDGGPALLDCLEFDDRLRYVDVIDDAAFLAMDLEFLGRPDLAELFLDHYGHSSSDDSPPGLRHFYVAYRAVVRAKVDCVRHGQGDPRAGADARRHLAIARDHLRAAEVRLILVGGGPGTGKTTLASGLGERIGAQVISTDDVRAEMVRLGELSGEAGVLGEGLYTRENVDKVYDAVLHRARRSLGDGQSVILDGTWRQPMHRERARDLAGETRSTIHEFCCSANLDEAVERVATRTGSTSQVTPEIAAALADREAGHWPGAHQIDTSGSPAEAVDQAFRICR